MAGVYLSNNDAFKKFSTWLNDSMKLKGVYHPLTAHISSFFEDGISKEQLLEYSKDVFLELVYSLDSSECADELMPILVIPLGFSLSLCPWDNSLLSNNQETDESPSIFIFDREKLKYLQVIEEYKVPIDIGINELKRSNFSIYYRCFRDSIAIENGWEYNRAIYVEYYTDSLLL